MGTKPGGGGGGGGATSGNDTLVGTLADNTISGLGGNDTISGLGGNDTLAGNAGADTIDGGDGNDTLYSGDISPTFGFPYMGNPYTPPLLDTGAEVDTVKGGAGDDVIFAGYGDTVDGGEGVDLLYISFQGASAGISFDTNLASQVIGGGTITGVEGANWIEGSNYDDTIVLGSGYYSQYGYEGVALGLGGNDTLIAGYNTWVLDGGDGDDIVDGRNSQYLREVDGGAGNDTLYTNANASAVANGGDGNDTIYANGEIHGGAGDDTIYVLNSYYGGPVTGDAGNDTIYGSVSSGQLDGGAGNDVIVGAAGDNILIGGTGDDTLTGGDGNDRFIYQSGHDTITDLQAGEVVEIDGYQAAQSILQNGTDVVVTLSANDQITFQNTDVATVSDSIQFGPPTDDTVIGGPGDDTLHGYGGNDSISGNGGNDTLYGNDGDDVLAGGAGADYLNGGTGNDVLFSGDISPEAAVPYFYTPTVVDVGSEADTIVGGAGDDLIFAGYGDNVDGGDQTGYGDELVISFEGASQGITFDAHLATQTIGGGTITGIENIAWVQGSNFDDYIDVGTNSGNGYSDFTTILGMGGNDTLIAGNYTGFMDGGDGDDIVDGRNSGYVNEVDGGSGNDIVYAPAGFAVANGGDGNDVIYAHDEAHGGSGDDTIDVDTPYFGISQITGDDGNDTITGSDAVDQIDGGAGDDTINGGAGDDILKSGSGDNVLTGGAGNDTFTVADGNNVITDFSSGDRIGVQASFSGSAITQLGSDVVIALDNQNELTFKNTDVATIKAALQSSVKMNDVVISPDGSTIYGSGDDGTLYSYDAATGELLHAWHVGVELGGMDVSSDGKFAVVTDLQPLSASESWDWPSNQFTAAVYEVDLTTGAVTTYTTTLTGDEYAFFDASILGNGQVLLTEQILPGWSGWAPMRTLDLATGEFAEASSAIRQDSVLTGDGPKVLVGEANISDARVDVYTAGSGVTAVHQNYADGVEGFNDGVQAYSANGGLAAQSLGSEIYVYNSQLQYKVDLSQLHPELTTGGVAGLAFDSSGKYLFVLNLQDDAIYQVLTSDWSIVGKVAVGVDITSIDSRFGNGLLVASDTSYFVVATDSGFIKVAAAQTLTGTSADDTLTGGPANDSLSGLDGNDTLRGGTGSDTLTGGAGNDTFLYGMGDGSDIITDFAGGDTTKISGYSSAKSVTQVGSDVVVVFATGDQITFLNSDVATVQASLDFDVQAPMNLTGTAGNDTLTGGTGNDTLNGIGGNDILDGKGGADTMIGGAGNDTYYVDNAGDVIKELTAQGTDLVHSTISYTLGANVENGTLDGTAAINLTGNSLVNMLTGNSGDNFLYGMGGNDKLIGGAGNDTLRGGLGTDTLTGGLGADLFQFEKGGGNDKVTDFVSGTDKIDLHLISGITSADVHWAVSRGNTIISVDANHDGRADFTITLTGASSINSGDFIFG